MTRYLVIQLARFGDLVQTKRLLLSLAARENAEVHLAVDRSLAPLAAILYPFAVVHGLCAHAGNGDATETLTWNRNAFAELGKLSFHAVHTVNFSELSFALAGLFDPVTVFGYRRENGQNLRSLWSRMAFRWTRERRISPVNLVDFWGYFASRPGSADPPPVAPEAVNPVARPRGTGRIGVVLSGREARRSLPPPALAACVEAVFAAMGGPAVILVGSASERPLARQLMRRFPKVMLERTHDHSGRTAITDLPDLFSGLDALITPDTGAMHLAAHLGVPVLAFFLSSAWAYETGPYGLGHRIWQAVRECSPCVETRPCPYDVACLAPFGEASFPRGLSGRSAPPGLEDWPSGLVELEPCFDALGQDYRVARGNFDAAARRLAVRRSLAAALGLEDGKPDSALTEFLVHENDWMLPHF